MEHKHRQMRVFYSSVPSPFFSFFFPISPDYFIQDKKKNVTAHPTILNQLRRRIGSRDGRNVKIILRK